MFQHPGEPRAGRHSFLGALGRLVLAATVAASTVLGAASTVAAAQQSKGFTQTFTGGGATLLSAEGFAPCDECVPDALFPNTPGAIALGVSVKGEIDHVDYTADTKTGLTYNDSELRQGATLHVTDVFQPTSGKVELKGKITGSAGFYNSPNGDPLGPWFQFATISPISIPFDETLDCAMIFSGATETCDVTLASLPVLSLPVLYPLFVDLSFDFKVAVEIDGNGVATVRSADVVGGDNLASDPLTFDGASPITKADSVYIPCTAPVGSDASYAFTGTAYTPNAFLESNLTLNVDASLEVVPGAPHVTLWDKDLDTWNITKSPVDLSTTAPDASTDLGPIAKNNVPPVADTGLSLYTGNQAQPITFNGLGSKSVCGFPTLRWDFSDGGVAYGPLPQHTFQGSGHYSGLLTASDVSGLTSTQTFAIDVANVAPVANAGPDTSAAWGKQIQFNGSAVDGTDDMATLAYSWSFGDGSPSATGGPSVLHTYAAPGTYTATLTVTDQHGAQGTDTRVVTVNQRSTTSAFLGSNGIYDTAGTLSASFTDQFGNPMPGRTITFSVDGSAVGSAQTNASGIATLAYTPAVNAGNHSVAATFAGDALYGAASASGSINVALKATTVTYNGAVSGGPNKTVTLQAVLKDATGTALAGRTVTFKLGTQTATATTDANGVAATKLTLNQKLGNYPLTATYAPAGADAGHYSGSAASITFSLKK